MPKIVSLACRKMQPDARMEGCARHLCGAGPAEVADSLTTGGFREAGLLAVVPVPGFWDTSGQYPLSVSEGDCTSTPVVARLCSQVLKFDCQESSAQPVIKFNSRVRESLAGRAFSMSAAVGLRNWVATRQIVFDSIVGEVEQQSCLDLGQAYVVDADEGHLGDGVPSTALSST